MRFTAAPSKSKKLQNWLFTLIFQAYFNSIRLFLVHWKSIFCTICQVELTLASLKRCAFWHSTQFDGQNGSIMEPFTEICNASIDKIELLLYNSILMYNHYKRWWRIFLSFAHYQKWLFFSPLRGWIYQNISFPAIPDHVQKTEKNPLLNE